MNWEMRKLDRENLEEVKINVMKSKRGCVPNI